MANVVQGTALTSGDGLIKTFLKILHIFSKFQLKRKRKVEEKGRKRKAKERKGRNRKRRKRITRVRKEGKGEDMKGREGKGRENKGRKRKERKRLRKVIKLTVTDFVKSCLIEDVCTYLVG